MEPRLTFLGRSAHRWRVRVEIPECARLRGLTVGLWGPDARPLAPGVVLPVARGSGPTLLEAELGGPAELPAGSEVRCMVDLEGDAHPLVTCIGLDRRRGLAAWLHADARLHVQADAPRAVALAPRELRALALAWPGVFGEVDGGCAPPAHVPVRPEVAAARDAGPPTDGGHVALDPAAASPPAAPSDGTGGGVAEGGTPSAPASGGPREGVRGPSSGTTFGGASPPEADDLLSMLRDEFGVDVDDLDEDLRDVLTDDRSTR